MRIIEPHNFQKWLDSAGIGQASEDSRHGMFEFRSSPGIEEFWYPSCIPSKLPEFLTVAIEAISPHGPYYLFRRGDGCWRDGDMNTPLGTQIIENALEKIGVPLLAEGALQFEEIEWKDFLSVIITFYVHGWSMYEDLMIVAEERDTILMTSHHGKLVGRFPSREHANSFDSRMMQRGFGRPIVAVLKY